MSEAELTRNRVQAKPRIRWQQRLDIFKRMGGSPAFQYFSECFKSGQCKISLGCQGKILRNLSVKQLLCSYTLLPFLNLGLIFCKRATSVVASEVALLGLGSRVFAELELT